MIHNFLFQSIEQLKVKEVRMYSVYLQVIQIGCEGTYIILSNLHQTFFVFFPANI